MKFEELDCSTKIISPSDKFESDQCLFNKDQDKTELEENEIDSENKDKSIFLCKSSKVEISHQKENKSKKNFPKTFKCDICNKGYTWHCGLSNYKRFVHNKLKEM